MVITCFCTCIVGCILSDNGRAFVDGHSVTNNLSELARVRKTEFDGYRKARTSIRSHVHVNVEGSLRGVLTFSGQKWSHEM